jgi:hypothetical protein
VRPSPPVPVPAPLRASSERQPIAPRGIAALMDALSAAFEDPE